MSSIIYNIMILVILKHSIIYRFSHRFRGYFCVVPRFEGQKSFLVNSSHRSKSEGVRTMDIIRKTRWCIFRRRCWKMWNDHFGSWKHVFYSFGVDSCRLYSWGFFGFWRKFSTFICHWKTNTCCTNRGDYKSSTEISLPILHRIAMVRVIDKFSL